MQPLLLTAWHIFPQNSKKSPYDEYWSNPGKLDAFSEILMTLDPYATFASDKLIHLSPEFKQSPYDGYWSNSGKLDAFDISPGSWYDMSTTRRAQRVLCV